MSGDCGHVVVFVAASSLVVGVRLVVVVAATPTVLFAVVLCSCKCISGSRTDGSTSRAGVERTVLPREMR